ncbi:MAG: hypothetical protein ACE5KM_11120 [Planctomycetaceae bacterium]
MELDRTTVPLHPRRALGCLDVAVRFYGEHLMRMLAIWVVVALPFSVLVYLLTVRSQMDVRLTLIVLYAATWISGVLTVAGSARALFGEPFFPDRGREADFLRVSSITVDIACVVVFAFVAADVTADMLGTDFVFGAEEAMWYWGLFALLATRLILHFAATARVTPGFWKALSQSGVRRALLLAAPLLILFPMHWGLVLIGIVLSIVALLVALRTSFLPESIFLSSLDEKLHGRGVRDLLKKEGGDLFARSLLIVPFCVLLSIVVFFTIDQACNLLLGYPILLGRLDQILPRESIQREADTAFGDAAANGIGRAGTIVIVALKFLLSDSRCLAVLTAAVLFVFPIARLAWFFCYIDLRVRRDCWDMELLFQQEARRLERTA